MAPEWLQHGPRWSQDATKMTSRRISRISVLSRRFPFSCYSGDGKRRSSRSERPLRVSVVSLRTAERSEAGKGGSGGNPGARVTRGAAADVTERLRKVVFSYGFSYIFVYRAFSGHRMAEESSR